MSSGLLFGDEYALMNRVQVQVAGSYVVTSNVSVGTEEPERILCEMWVGNNTSTRTGIYLASSAVDLNETGQQVGTMGLNGAAPVTAYQWVSVWCKETAVLKNASIYYAPITAVSVGSLN